MAFDGIIAKAVVCELNKCIINGKISKIYEPNKNEVLLGIYSMGKNYALCISIDPMNYRINLTTHQKQNPKNALNFCMVLRKHILGGTIKKIYMKGLERIIYIDIECYKDEEITTKTLVVELMGKHGNIILINKERIIIDSIRHLNKFKNSKRDILPGNIYNELESNKKDFIACTYDEFMKNIEKNNLADSISRSFIGISKLGIELILEEINPQKNISKEVYEYLKELLEELNKGNINLEFKEIKNRKKREFYIKNTDNYKKLSLNFALDDFYYNKENEEELKNEKNSMLNAILDKVKKLQYKLKFIKEKLKECDKKEDYKLYGELITANLYRIENYNQKSVVLENYYKNNEKIEIPLDNKITPSVNAKKFFKKYKKLQNTELVVNKQEELIKQEIDYLESLVYDINNCSNLEELEEAKLEVQEVIGAPKQEKNKKKGKKLAIMLAEYNINGFTVYVGKNNKQNDYLTCKIAKSTDIWFHTKDIHGSHVVLKILNKTKKVPDSIIYKCATIAAYYSKAKMSSNVPVDYTYIKYVRKPKGAKPGMVIYTDNKTIFVNPQKPE